jgi:GT2 family glycosyltransferase
VSVIIPAGAKTEHLRSCLRALSANGPREIPFETIVVLNAGAAEELREWAPGVHWVHPGANLGLAGAGNRGRAVARGELLILLHDDAEVQPGWMEALVEMAERHPEAGAVGGLVRFPDGRLQNAGMILWQDGTTSPPWIGEPPEASAFDRPRAVDYCGTSSLLVRAAVWDAVGGLDERFYPAYYVDVDLAMAVRRLGGTVLYQPRSSILHHQGASGNLRFRVFVTQRNRKRFLEKWGSALDMHEPREESLAAIQRAIDRAASFASGRSAPALPAPEKRPFDPDAQERRSLESALALQKDYAAHLAAALDEAVAEGSRWRETAAALERELAEERRGKIAPEELAELRARAAVLDVIERGRWWRLYQRLLPLLRPLSKVF